VENFLIPEKSQKNPRKIPEKSQKNPRKIPEKSQKNPRKISLSKKSKIPSNFSKFLQNLNINFH